ncbi:MAG: TetM/TetW/TetO/TetS family tetracycline resistance ribosomal protection protein [Clostridia bacterium]|nr:TetM/TetW/TetO/TetS family tetracycline resistance ribosomal protection protein [Clostridia bacterium]
MKKSIALNILAHVDAGKTTLSEALLYLSGAIDRLGRVDKRDAYFDTDPEERERGITIFAKQADIETEVTHITLIDTPGHIDFSCETERTLSVADYAVLVVSAPDGVRSHTKTLWGLLRARRIPTFIFVNKCDISGRLRAELLEEMKTVLSPACVDFTLDDTPEFYENVSGLDERLMSKYFDGDMPTERDIAEAVRRGNIYPCLFGSALKLDGVERLLSVIDKYTLGTEYSDALFGAVVYKIARDAQDRRLTFVKITGGALHPKDTVEVRLATGERIREKVEEIRVFSADRSRQIKSAAAGTVCALVGPMATRAGMGLGTEADDISMLAPVLDYRITFPGGESPHDMYAALSKLAEEEPSLNLKFDSRTGEIRVSLMGEIQIEVLKRLILTRLGVTAEFDEGEILYKESVGGVAYGAGHFEPLRHYAEVHLKLEPLPAGSGIIADTECDRDTLPLSFQRLVMTHITERVHRGTAIGAPLTDVRITLVTGRAHAKHTEGGDFRQATYRAIRQALRKNGTVILEPTFSYRAELPRENMGRLLTDIANMHGRVDSTEIVGDTATLSGVCPVATMRSYPTALRTYTKGAGRLTMSIGEYEPAHNPDEIIATRGYDPDLDERNPSGSVFCRAGAGYTVPWDEADALMHVKPYEREEPTDEEGEIPKRARAVRYSGTLEEDRELMRIFEATYGKPKPRHVSERVVNEAPNECKRSGKPRPRGEEYLILDAYNVIYAWDELSHLAELEISLARDALVRIMCSFSAMKKIHTIVVFDAYNREGEGSVLRCGPVTVVYTKHAETADTYIERATYKIAPTNYVRVATGDLAEQFVILGNGAYRMSPRELKLECESVTGEIEEYIRG